jgi:phage shock protein E
MMKLIPFVFSLIVASGTLRAQDATPSMSDVKRITLADFKKLYDAGQVVVVDVRSVEAYREGHIPGAISMPLTTIADRVGELKDVRQRIVTYCT